MDLFKLKSKVQFWRNLAYDLSNSVSLKKLTADKGFGQLHLQQNILLINNERYWVLHQNE